MSVAAAPPGRLGAFWAWLAPLTAPERRIEVVGGVTLMVLLLTTEDTWPLRVGMGVLGVAALADRRLVRSAAYWFAVLGVYVVGVRGLVVLLDNHEFLLGYWILALAVSRLVADPVAGLATSARLLVGFGFGFATLWKVITPEYTAGGSFHAFLLFDERFVGIGPALSALTSEQGRVNYEIAAAAIEVGDASAMMPVFDAPGVRVVALVMTWWTVAIEGIVALAFLAPVRSWLGQARHALLLVFLYTTYALAPVTGFGWLLVAMGLADAPLERSRWFLPAFGVAFALVILRGAAPIGRLLGLS